MWFWGQVVAECVYQYPDSRILKPRLAVRVYEVETYVVFVGLSWAGVPSSSLVRRFSVRRAMTQTHVEIHVEYNSGFVPYKPSHKYVLLIPNTSNLFKIPIYAVKQYGLHHLTNRVTISTLILLCFRRFHHWSPS